MSDVAIRVENLGKQYRIGRRVRHDTLRDAMMHGFSRLRRNGHRKDEEETFWALKDISFEVERGEIVGVIGRNGAGKSTLLKILSRITEPTTGRAEIHGRVGSLLEVGTGFHPELTGRENVYLNGAILGMKKAEIDQRFDEIVAFAEIERFLDTPVKRYSSGMYVRLAFAVAAHLEPEILLVDEVLAVGDTSFQRKCLGKMGDVAHEGRTVLFVSHNMAAIQQLCTRALLIASGSLETEGEPRIVTPRYLAEASEGGTGEFDLLRHPARAGGSSPTIHRLVMTTPDGTPTTRFCSGDQFRVEVLVVPLRTIVEPRVALAIEDSQGRRILTLASYFQDRRLPDFDRPTRLACVLPQLSLGTGRYLLSASIASRAAGMLDSIDAAVWFEVDWRDFYGNGEPYKPVYGPVLARSHWAVIGGVEQSVERGNR